MKFLFGIITAIALMIPISGLANDEDLWIVVSEKRCKQGHENSCEVFKQLLLEKGAELGVACIVTEFKKYFAKGEFNSEVLDAEDCVKKKIWEYSNEK